MSTTGRGKIVKDKILKQQRRSRESSSSAATEADERSAIGSRFVDWVEKRRLIDDKKDLEEQKRPHTLWQDTQVVGAPAELTQTQAEEDAASTEEDESSDAPSVNPQLVRAQKALSTTEHVTPT